MTPSLERLESSFNSTGVSLPELLSLRRELQTPFKLHPLGFIACTLLSEGTRRLRLHYWPVDSFAQQSPKCLIHDHRFEFRSWVVAGAVENIEYSASHVGIKLAVYQTEYADDQSILTRTGATQNIVEQRRSIHVAGTTYALSAGVLHETVRVGAAAAFTVLITNDVTDAAPLVLGPVTGQHSYMYRREDLSEAVVERMLAGINHLGLQSVPP